MKKNITGVMIDYYFICKRKLWLFSNYITLEQENENVLLGKLIDENSYSCEKKHILIDGTINIDFIKNWEVIHEVKKTESMEEANIWQLKYYLYFLKKRGINIKKGILDYPKLKKRKEIFLESGDEQNIEQMIENIEKIIFREEIPKFEKTKICKKCAYYDYCVS